MQNLTVSQILADDILYGHSILPRGRSFEKRYPDNGETGGGYRSRVHLSPPLPLSLAPPLALAVRIVYGNISARFRHKVIKLAG